MVCSAKSQFKIKFFGACSVPDFRKLKKNHYELRYHIFYESTNFHCYQSKEPCLTRKNGDLREMLSDPCLNIAEHTTGDGINLVTSVQSLKF